MCLLFYFFFYNIITLNYLRLLCFFYLNACFRKVGAHGETFPHYHIRVVGLLESFLQGLKLLGGEGCATAPLLSVLRAIPGLKDNVLKCAAVEKEETRPV